MSRNKITPRETADRLDVSIHTVYRLMARGTLQAIDVSWPGAERSTWMVYEDTVDALLRNRELNSA